MSARWMERNQAKLREQNAELRTMRPVTMPTSHDVKAAERDAIAAYLANDGKVTRVPCTGRMPTRCYGRKVGAHDRAGLNLKPISERAAREKAWNFAPRGLVNWKVNKEWKVV